MHIFDPAKFEVDKREYGSSEHSLKKYQLFNIWHEQAAFVLGKMFPNRAFIHIDVTAGPGIDKCGNRNVLAGAIDAYRKAGIFESTVFVAFETSAERYESLRDFLSQEKVLASRTDALFPGTVLAINSTFNPFISELSAVSSGMRGNVCFDPRPDLKSIDDSKELIKAVPQEFAISSFIGEKTYARMAAGEEYYGRDGYSRSSESVKSVLKGIRKYQKESKQYGKCGGRVCIFTNVEKSPAGFISCIDEHLKGLANSQQSSQLQFKF